MGGFTKFFIILNVVVFVAFGLAFLIAPAYFASTVEIEVPSPTALADFRAIYGGLSLSVGVFFALGLSRPALVLPVLWLIAASSLALALGRIYSTIVSGVPGSQIFLFTGIELAAFAVGTWLYARESRSIGPARAPITTR